MIISAIYLVLFCFVIYKTSFFGVLKDEVLNNKFYLLAFLFKVSGITVFYVVYQRFYGGIYYSDTYHFFEDSKVIYSVSKWNFSEFVKLMLGVADESANTELFQKYLHLTGIWDKNPEELIYNDNRLIVRLNVLIHFISFGNYFVHALISSLMAFLGINWIYKTFAFLFPKKEIALFFVWLAFPGIWFWTSGLFKEGPALFLMGMLLISLKRVLSDKRYGTKNILMLFLSVVFSFMFKTYLLIPLLVFTVLFFGIVFVFKSIKHNAIVYLTSIVVMVFVSSFALKIFFSKSPVEVISDRQKNFIDVSRGGIFLLALDSSKFLRLPYDFKTVTIDSSIARPTAKISLGASYLYCDPMHEKDTLYCQNNVDTTTSYVLYYYFSKANSTFEVPAINNSTSTFIKILPYSLYITLFKPFFYDARNALDMIDSFENLMILISLLILAFNSFKDRKNGLWCLYFLSIAFCVLLVIGVTSPNIGAIERYRALIIPFIFMSTLLSLDFRPIEKLNKFLKNTKN